LPGKLAEALAENFSKDAKKELPVVDDHNLASEIALYRRRRLLDSRVIAVESDATVVIPDESLALPEPVFGKTLHVVQVRDVREMQRYLSPYLQSVSIAGTLDESQTLAETLATHGVKRFPSVGRITNFENPWDGEDILSSLVRFSTLGGP